MAPRAAPDRCRFRRMCRSSLRRAGSRLGRGDLAQLLVAASGIRFSRSCRQRGPELARLQMRVERIGSPHRSRANSQQHSQTKSRTAGRSGQANIRRSMEHLFSMPLRRLNLPKSRRSAGQRQGKQNRTARGGRGFCRAEYRYPRHGTHASYDRSARDNGRSTVTPHAGCWASRRSCSTSPRGCSAPGEREASASR